MGARRDHVGHLARSRERVACAARTSRASTSSSSAAARRTSAPGSRRPVRPASSASIPTPAQLETARRCNEKFGLGLEFVEAFGEDVPLPGRVVRPRGLGVRRLDLGRSVQVDPRGGAAPASGWRARLSAQLDARHPLLAGRGRAPPWRRCSVRSSGCTASSGRTQGVEYHLSHGDWIRLLRANGFELLDLIEIQAPADAETHEHYAYVTADWARKWPAEEIWRARLRPRSS